MEDAETALRRRRFDALERVLGGGAAFSIAALAFLLSAGVLFAACGGGGGQGSAAGGCEVGKPPLVHLRRVPVWVAEQGLDSPPLVLDCFASSLQGPTEMVGFRNVGPSVCVTFDTINSKQAHGELCTEADKTPAEEWCKGASGCIKGYVVSPRFTEFSGPLEPYVRSAKVTVGGEPARGEVEVKHVSGKQAESIHAKKPFAYFIAFLPGCVAPKRVQVLLYGAEGAKIGVARGWDAPAPCASG